MKQDYFRGAIYNNSEWNSTDFTAVDMDFALKVNPGSVNTAESNLSAFYSRGGKLIAYHGRNDNVALPLLFLSLILSLPPLSHRLSPLLKIPH